MELQSLTRVNKTVLLATVDQYYQVLLALRDSLARPIRYIRSWQKNCNFVSENLQLNQTLFQLPFQFFSTSNSIQFFQNQIFQCFFKSST